MMDFFKKSMKGLLSAIYPKKCICCGRTIPENADICVLCEENIEHFSAKKRCKSCGLEKKRCRCKTNVFHFCSVIAPLYNKGVARIGFYRYKLGCHEQYADFFADKMIECINSEYLEIYFDAVCCVPPSKNRIFKYGFNTAQQLARIIADKKGIEFIDEALVCLKAKSVQHKANKRERFELVKGKYTWSKRLDNKRVLLVDDIISTGATLDECARQLLLGGAREVYCVTALITDNKSGEITEYAKGLLKRGANETKEKI